IIEGREKLEQFIQQLASDLSRGQAWKVEDLAPAWQWPDDFPQVVGEGVPVWMTVLVIAGLVLVLILVFRWVALHEANEAASVVRRALLGAG
ncbi:MAG: DotU family type IV/VI secretion system protein, partial [Candidatus Eisenbacteria bacterium]|nr:DotU family type IV/VI secretion system protein [Candidatus Eisenbacteria bacterium]